MLREFPHSITAYMNNHSGGSSEYHEIGYIFIVTMEQKTEIERIQEELIKIKQKEKKKYGTERNKEN